MKYMAIEKELEWKDPDDKVGLLRKEAERIYQIYLSGILRECYFTREKHTAVLILECGDKSEARQVIDSLPLVKAGVIDFELWTLGPYTGLDRMFSDRWQFPDTPEKCSPGEKEPSFSSEQP